MDDTRRRCSAHRTDGAPCRGLAIRGGAVCHVHGGAAPQVKDAARRRLESFVLPALAELRKLIASADSDAVKLAAIKDVLDRTGFKAAEQFDVQSDGRVIVEVELVDRARPVPESRSSHSTRLDALETPYTVRRNGNGSEG